MIIAIDPGVTGAIAVAFGGEISVEDMPTVTVKTSTGKNRTHYDLQVLNDLFKGITDGGETSPLVVIEHVGPMPRDGSVQAFSLGRGFGVLEGMCTAYGAKIIYVTPPKWKKSMGVTSDKETSLAKAREIFPHLAEELKYKKNHGRAEALLLLQYGIKTVLGDPCPTTLLLSHD